MILLLDIGNSSVKWATEVRGQFNATGAFSYSNKTFSLDIEKKLFFQSVPDAVLVSNVAGESIFNRLNHWVTKKWQIKCWQPNVSRTYKNLKNGYYEPEMLGLDRWLAILAAWEKYQTALCLVSCGTAMTIDLLNSDGQHIGGYIIPGIELMQNALVNNTAQINSVIEKEPSLKYAKDTQKAINNGAFLATVATIDTVMDRYLVAVSNSKVQALISGGMASLVKPLLKNTFQHEPDLILLGLSTLFKTRNKNDS